MKGELIDTNILVYAYDRENSAKQSICKKLIDECWQGRRTFFISLQNLAEFMNITRKANKISKEEAALVVKDILKWSYWKKLSYNEGILQKAVESGSNIFDALILETAIENNVDVIYTENVHHFKTDKVKVVNPLQHSL